jgi:predicted nuclease of predicted toxin-antitoxin system
MNPFAVKLENLGQTHVRFLKDFGYQADRVHDEGLSGADDETVWERVVSEGRFLITLDLDFSDIRRFQPGSHPGILLLRVRSKSRGAVLVALRRVLAEQRLEELRGCLAVADEDLTRVRRPDAE